MFEVQLSASSVSPFVEILGPRRVQSIAQIAASMRELVGSHAVWNINSTAAGGHISHNTVGVFGRRIQNRGMSLSLDAEKHIPLHFFPLAEDMWHLDVQKSIDLIEEVKPRMVVLGKSLFLFPEPLTEISAVCKEKNIPILYDAAHVLGLLVGGQFQDPWREGATWVTASTHKTFPGPQRGVGTWDEFLKLHAATLWQCDFLCVRER